MDAPRRGGELDWVREHLGHVTLERPDAIEGSTRWRGGQRAADAALASYDVTGYARRRNEVWPAHRRGASGLSPYIRHGLLSLRRVWDHVADGPAGDRRKYRDELLWQEYARHVYARIGTRTARPMRRQPAVAGRWDVPWPQDMACMELTVGELERDGWLVNQTRMWLASQWVVRAGARWTDGEHQFFQHLLDGSRAANRLGWQWTIGSATGKPYGFSRWQVERRAPGLCASCERRDDCPIQGWPETSSGLRVEEPAALRLDPDPVASSGPTEPVTAGRPEAVWLTAESLGDEDPALVAHPELPVVFVFDEPLLTRLRAVGQAPRLPGRDAGRPGRPPARRDRRRVAGRAARRSARGDHVRAGAGLAAHRRAGPPRRHPSVAMAGSSARRRRPLLLGMAPPRPSARKCARVTDMTERLSERVSLRSSEAIVTVERGHQARSSGHRCTNCGANSSHLVRVHQ